MDNLNSSGKDAQFNNSSQPSAAPEVCMQMEQPCNSLQPVTLCASSEAEDILSRAVKKPCQDIIPSHWQRGHQKQQDSAGAPAVNHYSIHFTSGAASKL